MSERLPDYVEIVVIDNSSEDRTLDVLNTISKHNVRILSNTNNIGLVGSFIRFFHEVEAPYLVFVSDEDEVLCERLEEYVRFLTEKKPCAAVASTVSDRVVADHRKLRSWRKTTKLAPNEFWHFGYISSVTFNVKESKKYLVELEQVSKCNEFVMIYPHVALAMRLFLEMYDMYFYEVVLAVKRYRLDTSIRASSGDKYYYIEPRCRQFKGLYWYCGYLEQTEGADSVLIEQMRSEGVSRILEWLEKGIAIELPAMHPYFFTALKKKEKEKRSRFMRVVRRLARYISVNILGLKALL